jgi:hypothetical protein
MVLANPTHMTSHKVEIQGYLSDPGDRQPYHCPAKSNYALLNRLYNQVELYLVLDPLIDKPGAIRLAEQLRHYVSDKQVRAENCLSST